MFAPLHHIAVKSASDLFLIKPLLSLCRREKTLRSRESELRHFAAIFRGFIPVIFVLFQSGDLQNNVRGRALSLACITLKKKKGEKSEEVIKRVTAEEVGSAVTRGAAVIFI